jgi:hypothetical protein
VLLYVSVPEVTPMVPVNEQVLSNVIAEVPFEVRVAPPVIEAAEVPLITPPFMVIVPPAPIVVATDNASVTASVKLAVLKDEALEIVTLTPLPPVKLHKPVTATAPVVLNTNVLLVVISLVVIAPVPVIVALAVAPI